MVNRSISMIGFDVTADVGTKLEENFEVAIDGEFSVELRFKIDTTPIIPSNFVTLHLRRGFNRGRAFACTSVSAGAV